MTLAEDKLCDRTNLKVTPYGLPIADCRFAVSTYKDQDRLGKRTSGPEDNSQESAVGKGASDRNSKLELDSPSAPPFC